MADKARIERQQKKESALQQEAAQKQRAEEARRKTEEHPFGLPLDENALGPVRPGEVPLEPSRVPEQVQTPLQFVPALRKASWFVLVPWRSLQCVLVPGMRLQFLLASWSTTGSEKWRPRSCRFETVPGNLVGARSCGIWRAPTPGPSGATRPARCAAWKNRALRLGQARPRTRRRAGGGQRRSAISTIRRFFHRDVEKSGNPRLTVGTTNNLDELGFAESVRRASAPGFLGLAQNLVDRLKRVGAQVVFHRRPGTWGSFDPSLEMEVSGYRDIREVEHVLISREGSEQEAHMLFAHGTVGGKDMLVRWESDRPMNVLALRSELDELGFKGSAFSLDRMGGFRRSPGT